MGKKQKSQWPPSWTMLGRILLNSLILALVLYMPKLHFVVLMGYKRKYALQVMYIGLLKPIVLAVVFSLILMVPTNDRGIILRTGVFACLCMPWMYSCCAMFTKNISQLFECLLLTLHMNVNAYRIIYITVFYLTIFIMALELMIHWITVHRCRRRMKAKFLENPSPVHIIRIAFRQFKMQHFT